MTVFISWSGDRSRSLSLGLYDWLRVVVQRADPWLSDRDIEVGQRWTAELEAKIKEARFAILCVTPENANSPWLNFEAGALAEVIGSSRVVPLLLDMTKAELNFPLAQFQAVEASREGLFQLVRAVNSSLPSGELSIEMLTTAFEMGWPTFSSLIDECVKAKFSAGEVQRPADRDLLESVLTSVLTIEKSLLGKHGLSSRDGYYDAIGWDEHYFQGVKKANARGGEASDIAAIGHFSIAIAAFPERLHKNTLARLYTYRAAMFKRLGRLAEARNDLGLASSWAEMPKEVIDVIYNQACIEAMAKNRNTALQLLDQLKAKDVKRFRKMVPGTSPPFSQQVP